MEPLLAGLTYNLGASKALSTLGTGVATVLTTQLLMAEARQLQASLSQNQDLEKVLQKALQKTLKLIENKYLVQRN